MRANETAMHQRSAVHYIAMVYFMYPFQRSFVHLSRKDNDFNYIFQSPNVLPRLTLFRLALEYIAIQSTITLGIFAFLY